MVDCFAWLVDPAWLVNEVKQGAAGLTGFAGRLQYTVHFTVMDVCPPEF
jgi:hypothetical protein